MSVPPSMMAALMGQGGMGAMGGSGQSPFASPVTPYNMQSAMNTTGAGLSIQPGTGMAAGGPNLQQPGMGGNPVLSGQQNSQPGTGLSQAQKMMMAQSLMNAGQQSSSQQQPQMLPMNVGRNT